MISFGESGDRPQQAALMARVSSWRPGHQRPQELPRGLCWCPLGREAGEGAQVRSEAGRPGLAAAGQRGSLGSVEYTPGGFSAAPGLGTVWLGGPQGSTLPSLSSPRKTGAVAQTRQLGRTGPRQALFRSLAVVHAVPGRDLQPGPVSPKLRATKSLRRRPYLEISQRRRRGGPGQDGPQSPCQRPRHRAST